MAHWSISWMLSCGDNVFTILSINAHTGNSKSVGLHMPFLIDKGRLSVNNFGRPSVSLSGRVGQDLPLGYIAWKDGTCSINILIDSYNHEAPPQYSRSRLTWL